MSLDLYLKINPCKTCGHAEYINHFAITYNLAPMWYKIFPNDANMIPIEGLTGLEAFDILLFAREKMIFNPNEFEALNPENEFGNYEDFIHLLNQLISKCGEYPNGIWEAWR